MALGVNWVLQPVWISNVQRTARRVGAGLCSGLPAEKTVIDCVICQPKSLTARTPSPGLRLWRHPARNLHGERGVQAHHCN